MGICLCGLLNCLVGYWLILSFILSFFFLSINLSICVDARLKQVYVLTRPHLVILFSGFDQIYKTCFDFLLHGLSCQPLSQELSRSGKLGCHALLLHGSGSTAGGSGKSSLARALCNQLGRHPILAYVSIIECISLRGTLLYVFFVWNFLTLEHDNCVRFIS